MLSVSLNVSQLRTAPTVPVGVAWGAASVRAAMTQSSEAGWIMGSVCEIAR
jgi:hypothetical protein